MSAPFYTFPFVFLVRCFSIPRPVLQSASWRVWCLVSAANEKRHNKKKTKGSVRQAGGFLDPLIGDLSPEKRGQLSPSVEHAMCITKDEGRTTQFHPYIPSTEYVATPALLSLSLSFFLGGGLGKKLDFILFYTSCAYSSCSFSYTKYGSAIRTYKLKKKINECRRPQKQRTDEIVLEIGQKQKGTRCLLHTV